MTWGFLVSMLKVSVKPGGGRRGKERSQAGGGLGLRGMGGPTGRSPTLESLGCRGSSFPYLGEPLYEEADRVHSLMEDSQPLPCGGHSLIGKAYNLFSGRPSLNWGDQSLP